MSLILAKVLGLIENGQIVISAHGYDELAEDGIMVREVLSGVSEARVLEDYPEFRKGPCVLVLQKDAAGRPIHVVWGIAKNTERPAVLITAYRPDPTRWSEDGCRRLK